MTLISRHPLFAKLFTILMSLLRNNCRKEIQSTMTISGRFFFVVTEKIEQHMTHAPTVTRFDIVHDIPMFYLPIILQIDIRNRRNYTLFIIYEYLQFCNFSNF